MPTRRECSRAAPQSPCDTGAGATPDDDVLGLLCSVPHSGTACFSSSTWRRPELVGEAALLDDLAVLAVVVWPGSAYARRADQTRRGTGGPGTRAGLPTRNPRRLVRHGQVISLVVVERDIGAVAPPVPRTGRGDYAPRPVPASWPATRRCHEEVLARLTSAPFVLDNSVKQARRAHGIRLFLQWLGEQPGASWQQRWLATGADTAAADWREVPCRWLRERGPSGAWREATLIEALPVAISADLVRPSLRWLVNGGPARGGLLVRTLAASRDREGFARLQSCDGEVGVTGTTGSQLRYRAALLVAAHGGDVAAITVGDVMDLFDAEDAHDRPSGGRTTFYRVLHQLGISTRPRRQPCEHCAAAGNALPMS